MLKPQPNCYFSKLKYEYKEPQCCEIPNKGGVYARYNNLRWTLVE